MCTYPACLLACLPAAIRYKYLYVCTGMCFWVYVSVWFVIYRNTHADTCICTSMYIRPSITAKLHWHLHTALLLFLPCFFLDAIDSSMAFPSSVIHAFVHSFTQSLIHAFAHSLNHSFIHSCIHSFIPLFLPSFIHSCLHSFIQSCINSCILSFVHSFFRSFIPSFIRSFIH